MNLFLSLLVNFLLGASWAFSFFGATVLFFIFIKVNIFYALFTALVGFIPGAFMVLFIEYFILHQEKLDELKNQTKLLEELVSKS